MSVFLYSGNVESLAGLGTIMVKAPDGTIQVAQVTQAVRHGKKFLLGLKGVEEANHAAMLAGRELYIRSDQLPQLPAGEYYWRDLVGLRVITDRDEILGSIEEIFETGSNDVYVVRGDGREYLIPAVEDVVVEVNLPEGYMKIAPPDGLLEL